MYSHLCSKAGNHFAAEIIGMCQKNHNSTIDVDSAGKKILIKTVQASENLKQVRDFIITMLNILEDTKIPSQWSNLEETIQKNMIQFSLKNRLSLPYKEAEQMFKKCLP